MVVERGHARCPRCVSIADYVFVEYGSDGVRYEVRCRKCGECYGEDLRPSASGAVLAVVEPKFRWPPDHEPVPPRDIRAELAAHLVVARQRARSGADQVTVCAHAAGTQVRAWVLERRAAVERTMQRRGLAIDHTGG